MSSFDAVEQTGSKVDHRSVHIMPGGGLPMFPPGGPSSRARGTGCWRFMPDGRVYPGLPLAIAAVRAAHPDRPDLHALAWALLPRLPGRPRTSDNLKEEGARSRIWPMEEVVVSDPWLGMNTEFAVNVFWVESDKADWRERLARAVAAGMPAPAWTAEGTRGGHMGFILRTPVVTGHGDARTDREMQRLLSVTRSYACTAINGDHSAGLRGLTKNPFSSRWHVEVGAVRAVDLHDILDPLKALAEAEDWKAPRRSFKGSRSLREPSPDGRNCALFDLTRWWAYDGVVRDGAAMLATAAELNEGFAIPLGMGEVADVARSITKFMVNRYDGQGLRVSLPPEVAVERRAAGGRKSAAIRAGKRDEALRAAVLSIRARGEAPGQRQVAEEAGVSIGTVQRAWTMLWDTMLNPDRAHGDAPGEDAASTKGAAARSDEGIVNTTPGSPAHPLVVCESADADASTALSDTLDPAIQGASPAPSAVMVGVLSPPGPDAPSPVLSMLLQALLDDGEAVLRAPGETPVGLRGRAAVQACIDAGQGPYLLPMSFLGFLPGVKRLPTLPAGHDDWTAEGRLRRRRVAGAWRCEARKAWHSQAASAGMMSYSAAMAARHAMLWRERTADMARFDVDWLEVEPDLDVDMTMVAETREWHAQRRKEAAMGWAAKFKAEGRLGQAWSAVLMARDHGVRARDVSLPVRDVPARVAPVFASEQAGVLACTRAPRASEPARVRSVAPSPSKGGMCPVRRFRTVPDAIDIMAEMVDVAA